MSLPPAPRQPTPEEVGVLSTPKSCGDCSLCCKLLGIAELGKVPGVWCNHVADRRRCGIYADRPPSCRAYQCIWTLAAPLDERWRPDRAGFVLSTGRVDGEILVMVDQETPDAWRREPFYSQIKRMSDVFKGGAPRVLVQTRGRVIVVFPEVDIDLGPPNGMPNIEWGYEERDGRLQPFAHFAEPDAPGA
jgi:hypothetical protein